MGPQQFDLPVGETYETYDPAAPVTGVVISATVGVTLNWNLAGTELTDKGVEFGSPLWTGVGAGPLTLYQAASVPAQAVGQVAWSIRTHAITRVENDPPNKCYRWAVTPVIQLIRQVTPTGGLPDIEVAYTASDLVHGEWIAQP